MIYECPSSNTDKTSFQNVDNYFIHDYPPTPVTHSMLLLPLRYSVMNGDATSVFFAGQVPNALVAHWPATQQGQAEFRDARTAQHYTTAKMPGALPIFCGHGDDPH